MHLLIKFALINFALIKFALIFGACNGLVTSRIHDAGALAPLQYAARLPNDIRDQGDTSYGHYFNKPGFGKDDINAEAYFYPNYGIGAILLIQAHYKTERPLFGSKIKLEILDQQFYLDVQSARAAFVSIQQEGACPWSRKSGWIMPSHPPFASGKSIQHPPIKATILIIKIAERMDVQAVMYVKNAFVDRMEILEDTPPLVLVSIPEYYGPQESQVVPLDRDNSYLFIASYEKAINGYKTCTEGFYATYRDVEKDDSLWFPQDAGIHIIEEIPFREGIDQALAFLKGIHKHGYRGPRNAATGTDDLSHLHALASILVIQTTKLKWHGTMRIGGRVVVAVLVNHFEKQFDY